MRQQSEVEMCEGGARLVHEEEWIAFVLEYAWIGVLSTIFLAA